MTCVAIAWYDMAYDCSDRLRPLGGVFGAVSGPMKPAVVDTVYGGEGSMGVGGCSC